MNKKECAFVQTVWNYYTRHGRHGLPWRTKVTPYRVLVSEVMLQQTQVDRVIPKYKLFLKKFPSFKKLAEASLGEVLKEWQGLGYNRRAKNLHAAARIIMTQRRGLTPTSYEALVTLPGIGPYTAGAMMVFVYNEPLSMIETNIRTAYLHHFYDDIHDVTDKELSRYIEYTLDHQNPREWYWALMDYGTYIKKEFGNPNSRSKHYTLQSAFNGSDRQIRGAIVRLLSTEPYTRNRLLKSLSQFEVLRIDAQLEKLLREGMVAKGGQKYSLPT